MENNQNKSTGKVLHGNSAKIDAKKHVMPLFSTSATNGYGANAFNRGYHRLDYDEELAIDEVNSNPLS